MYAFECDKSDQIIYNNLLFNKYQEIQDDYRSFAIIFDTKIVAVTLLTTLNQLAQLLTLKKETVVNSCADFHE